MVNEFRIKKIGDSKFVLVPHEYLKVFNLDDYIYHCEVEDEGKTIIYRRMRKDENLKK